MADLTISPNLSDPDDFYAALIEAHDGLSKAQSDAFNARLILILANAVGGQAALLAALKAAELPKNEGN